MTDIMGVDWVHEHMRNIAEKCKQFTAQLTQEC